MAITGFDNVIISQFATTRIPLKVYVNGSYLTITEPSDIEDPIFGFGMDGSGEMHRFDYRTVEHLLVGGKQVTLDMYKKGMQDMFKDDTKDTAAAEKEEPAEEPAKEDEKEPAEEGKISLKSLVEITRKEYKARMDAYKVQIEAAEEKIKEIEDKIDELKDENIED